MARPTQTSTARAIAATVLLSACTLLGLAGIDLVLPAVPTLPGALGGSLPMAQLVLASFAAGIGLGLLLFGELGARFNNRKLLALALLAYAGCSWLAAGADTLQQLIALRFVQGIFAACAAVVAPGMVRALFGEQGALRAIGVLGSVESLAPAIAPVFGVWLLAWNGWQASFHVTAGLAALLALLVALSGSLLPAISAAPAQRGYGSLLASAGFQRYAFGQGCAIGGLLVFVFGMPVVITTSLGGELDDFIIMQMSGITTFIIAANLSHHAVARFGGDAVIAGGTVLALLGTVALCVYGGSGGID
ncbi:MAG TPA: MFS transporter, partial [Kineobactrum sp.]